MSRTDRNRMIDLRDGLDFRDRTGPIQTQRQLVQVYDGGTIPTTVPKVFLTYPVLVDADGTEGASPTFTADTGVTIPIVMLGPRVPVAGEQLVAHAIGGRWVARADEHATAPPVPCIPCNIPSKNLRLTYVDSRFGTANFTLVLGSPNNWTAACGPLFSNSAIWTFQCAFGSVYNLVNTVFTTSDCSLAPISSNNFNSFLVDQTCTPFHLHYQLGFTDIYVDYP